ncbi:PH domain-containing protein [Pseudonocardia thermophila]|uniref:PH domain-containing protein n=1 Tax=Pseudonocardia thermophila TaxID=1848 RepID=A0A1M6QJB8_PSETH|nr:PH domain-containing protein [Pseudonocardia thermophila]SHK20163.1 PH domain-containing protein [Pseudonocardia thermophila]
MSTDEHGDEGADEGADLGARQDAERSGQDGEAAARELPRAVFRPSPLVVLVAFAFAFCATPFAFGAPLFWLIYLIPVGMIVWAVRVRTVVDPDALTVRHVIGRRTVPWSEITSLHLTKSTRVRAVLSGGDELALPAVHVRNLPAMAAASGGRLPDPSADG